MSDRRKDAELEAIAKQVEQALKSGQADRVWAAGREVRDATLDTLRKAENLDPQKLRWIINI